MASSRIVKSILNSDELRQTIENVVDDKLSILRKDLINAGLEEGVVSQVFAGFSGNSFQDKNISDSSDYEETPQKPRRFLKPNSSPVEEEKVEEKTTYPQGEKSKISHSGNTIILCLNYGPKSHALFGDFDRYKSFTRNFLSKTSWIKPGNRLAFGPGWVIMDRSRIQELTRALDKGRIKYRKIERSDYEKEIRKNKYVEEDPEETEPESQSEEPKVRNEKREVKKEAEPEVRKEKVETKEEPPKKKQEEVKPKKKVSKNDRGNSEEPETGFVFVRLPVGKDGKLVPVAIGYQSDRPGHGLESVFPFVKNQEEECASRNWKYLNENILDILEENKPSLFRKYKAFMEKKSEEEEEEESGRTEDEEE